MLYAIQGPAACDSCMYARNGTTCVAACSPFTYPDEDNQCRPCHYLCHFAAGCTGPYAVLGHGGCSRCDGLWIRRHGKRPHCLDRRIQHCKVGFYSDTGGLLQVDTVHIPFSSRNHRLTELVTLVLFKFLNRPRDLSVNNLIFIFVNS